MRRAATLSIDLNLVDLSKTGYWFCLGCQRITEREESDTSGWHHCKLCGSCRIRWHDPIFPEPQPMITNEENLSNHPGKQPGHALASV